MVHAMLVMRAWLVNNLRAQATRSSHLARRAHTSSGLRRSSQRMTEKIHQRHSSLKVSGRLEMVGFLCPCTLVPDRWSLGGKRTARACIHVW